MFVSSSFVFSLLLLLLLCFLCVDVLLPLTVVCVCVSWTCLRSSWLLPLFLFFVVVVLAPVFTVRGNTRENKKEANDTHDQAQVFVSLDARGGCAFELCGDVRW